MDALIKNIRLEKNEKMKDSNYRPIKSCYYCEFSRIKGYGPKQRFYCDKVESVICLGCSCDLFSSGYDKNE